MLKNGRRQLARATYLGGLATLIITLTSPLTGISQQSSPVVPSNISAGDNAQSKRVRQSNPAGVVAVPEGFDKLELSPGYLLEMDIYNVPEMTSQLRIDAKGFATIPLIGSVHLEGDTVPEAQNAIAALFAAKEILKDPQVTLNILEYSEKNVSVLGEVQSPGRIELLAPATLEDVLASAGGETIEAGNDIEIQHSTNSSKPISRHVEYVQGKDSTPLQSTLVEPGDTVVVHRAGVIYVFGAVNRPGGYLMVNGGSLSVIEAISLAGGTTLQASTRWAMVIRRQGTDVSQFKIPLGRMETGDSPPTQLQLSDALYVPVSTWKAVLINGSNVLSAATSAAIYRAP
jgi:polysaccharide export outer membrane protein